MPYTITKTDGSNLLTLTDQTTDSTTTSLTFVGRGTLNWGDLLQDNFVRLLENFNNTTAPAHPVVGQCWWDRSTNKFKMWNGTSWLRFSIGTDDANLVPGLTFGSGLTLTSGTLTANVKTVAGRTGDVVLAVSDVAGGAPLASPALTGTPTAPTAAVNTSSTQLATTAFVRNQISSQVYNYGAGTGLTVDGSNNLDIVGTANRISVTSAGVDIASNYVGQASITTLGAISTGQWAASPIPLAYGGTGATSAAAARSNLNVLQYNALANSLSAVSNGIMVNNNSTAYGRQIVSGSASIVVANGNGVAGDISISYVGDSNSGPLAISAGGTGQTTQAAAFNALAPTTQVGDLILYGSSGNTRLASPGTSNGTAYYLTAGNGNAMPSWTTVVNASTLNGQAPSYYLNRANQTGTNNADLLNGQAASYYLAFANMTGTLAANQYITASNYTARNGYVVFSNSLQMVWGQYTNVANGATTVSFPLAFPNTCFWCGCSGGSSDATAQDNNPFIANYNQTQLVSFNSRDGAIVCSFFAIGY